MRVLHETFNNKKKMYNRGFNGFYTMHLNFLYISHLQYEIVMAGCPVANKNVIFRRVLFVIKYR